MNGPVPLLPGDRLLHLQMVCLTVTSQTGPTVRELHLKPCDRRFRTTKHILLPEIGDELLLIEALVSRADPRDRLRIDGTAV